MNPFFSLVLALLLWLLSRVVSLPLLREFFSVEPAVHHRVCSFKQSLDHWIKATHWSETENNGFLQEEGVDEEEEEEEEGEEEEEEL